MPDSDRQKTRRQLPSSTWSLLRTSCTRVFDGGWAVPGVFGLATLVAVAFAFAELRPGTRRIPSIAELITLNDAELGTYRIDQVNLACAVGLRHAESLDRRTADATIQRWADHVKAETQRNLHRFRKAPQEFENSEAYFKTLMMIVVLQQDLGVRYNAARIRDVDFTDSRDLFIHGLLSGHGGTCTSMPVLYVAVGRRLGYPLKLVTAKEHIFARWDNAKSGERFNIEATNRGLSTYPDEYYKQWPVPMSKREETDGCFLTSLTPRQELSLFLATRGHCLLDTARTDEALEAYRQAIDLWPENAVPRSFLTQAQRVAEQRLKAKNLASNQESKKIDETTETDKMTP